MPNNDPGVTLVSLLLADYANVREGLLNVVSGGITRMWPRGTGYPFNSTAHIAMLIYTHPHKVGQIIEGWMSLGYPEFSEKLAKFQFQITAMADVHAGEGLFVPFILPLEQVPFPHPGQVDVSVNLNGQIASTLTFWLVEPQ